MDVVLGIEVAEDRNHSAIVAAGRLDDGAALLDLLAYIEGSDAVPAVLTLRAERTVRGVVVDPHSPGATLIKPLVAAGVEVTEPTSSDVAVAHGLLLDELKAIRLRHAGQPELTAAMRAATARPLGGASALQRRGATVDVSPAVAAELALWGLLTLPEPQQFFGAWR